MVEGLRLSRFPAKMTLVHARKSHTRSRPCLRILRCLLVLKQRASTMTLPQHSQSLAFKCSILMWLINCNLGEDAASSLAQFAHDLRGCPFGVCRGKPHTALLSSDRCDQCYCERIFADSLTGT